MLTKNIVVCGKTGAGKSSVVNLIAGQEMANTSPGTEAENGTMHWAQYPIAFDGHNYKMFEIGGLEDPHLRIHEYLSAIANAYNLIAKLQNEGGIDLLLFCVRAGKVPTATIQANYRLFYEWLCEKKVPIILVLTGLEREKKMNNWWIRNKQTIHQHGILVDGHACITAVNGTHKEHKELYEESRRLVHKLVDKYTHGPRGGQYMEGKAWHMSFVWMLKDLLPENHLPKKEDIVTVLSKRCVMPSEVATELAMKIISDLRWRLTRYAVPHNISLCHDDNGQHVDQKYCRLRHDRGGQKLGGQPHGGTSDGKHVLWYEG